MLLMGVVLLSDEAIRGRLSVASNCFPIFALPKAASHRFAKPMYKVPSHESIWRPPHYVDQSFVRHHQTNDVKFSLVVLDYINAINHRGGKFGCGGWI